MEYPFTILLHVYDKVLTATMVQLYKITLSITSVDSGQTNL
jgi:hypothetical protein